MTLCRTKIFRCMTNRNIIILVSILAIAVSIFFGCSHREKVIIPPKMDLRSYGTVGIIDFASTAKKDLRPYVTQRYIQALQTAQPGVRVLELGESEQVLQKLKLDKINPDAVRAIGKAYHVDVLIFGQLAVSEPKPNFRLSSTWESMQARADVEASLLTKLWETKSGATLWTRSSRRTQNVASIKADTGGNISLGATDPEDTYGKLVPTLVHDNTTDFRSTYEYRKVK